MVPSSQRFVWAFTAFTRTGCVKLLVMRILGTLALLVALSACGGTSKGSSTAAPSPEPDPLAEARESCAAIAREMMIAISRKDALPSSDVIYEDRGSLIIDTPGGGGNTLAGVAFSAAECVLDALDAPGSVASRMGSSTALSGPGEATWDGYTASWSFNGSSPARFQASFDRLP